MINENRIILLVVAIASIGWVCLGKPQSTVRSREAVVRCSTGADLINGHFRGRQGLIGSLRWAPMPTLFVLPMMGVPGLASSGLASCIVAGLAAAIFVAFLNRWLISCGVGWFFRYAALALVVVNPMWAKSIQAGQSTLLFALLVVGACCFLIHWLQTLELRSLAYLSILCALLVLTRYQAVVFVGVIFLIVLIYLLVEREREAYTEGTLIVLLSPTLYAVALWFAANWLIMGDALFFLRGFGAMEERGMGLREILLEGCEWGSCLLPLFIALLAWVFTQFKPSRPLSLVRGVALVALALCGMVVEHRDPTPLISKQEELARKELDDVVAEVDRWLGQHKVVVSGYEGYMVRQRTQSLGMFIHRLSIHLDKVLKDTRGQQLYLLVPTDKGDGWWEDMNLTYPGIYQNGSAFTIFEKRWAHWHLFRVVRTDGRQRLEETLGLASAAR